VTILRESVMGKANSVAEALSRAHAALLEDLRKLEEAADPSSSTDLAEMRARLGATQAHITEHFRFEEENGYLEALQKREPRLEPTIQQLAEEHRQLAQSLEALVGEARSATSLGNTFREKTRQWIKRVRQHEHRENDLVQDAFNLDIGAED
jgi:predicted  nucleic acid-binding Zn-ribbon protein